MIVFNQNSYLLHFCSTNRGTSTGFLVQPVSLPQQARTLTCLPTGHVPKAGSCPSACCPASVSPGCFPWGISLTCSETERISEISTGPCVHCAFIVQPSWCSSESGRDKSTQLIVWHCSIALFSSFKLLHSHWEDNHLWKFFFTGRKLH